MTVASLIEALQKFDPALEIVLKDHSYLIKPEQIKVKEIKSLYFNTETMLQISH